MPRGRIGRILPGRANGSDLELRQGLQSWNVGNRGEPASRTGPDDPDADFAVSRHNLRFLR